MGSFFPTDMLMLEQFQLFHVRGDESMVTEQTHALWNVLRVMAALEDFLGFFVFGHKCDSGQEVALIKPWGTNGRKFTSHRGKVNSTLAQQR
jgi:hypothetical protein